MEFGNVLLKLSQQELIDFTEYVSKVDFEYWLQKNKDCFNTRKLMLDIGAKKCGFALHVTELKELLALLKDSLQKVDLPKNVLFCKGQCLN